MDMNKRAGRWVLMLGLIVLFALGFALGRIGEPGAAAAPAQAGSHEEHGTIWTCSMHPQIRQPGPGQCPICAMDLIPVASSASGTASRELTLSDSARKLAEVRTAPVERRPVETTVRLVGKVRLDESRVAVIAPRVPGRIDRLYVNFVGVNVRAGDHLADFYSPDLIAAQQDLIQAGLSLAAQEKQGGGPGLDQARALRDAAREKLRLLQLTPAQVAMIEREGRPQDRVTFYSPLSGIVVDKMDTYEGMYVETGMKLFTVADLSKVWIKLDAYESDLAWIRYGQPVAFEADAWPGDTFTGTVAFIDPMLDPMSRTVRVRVNAENAGGRLKPEMFVRASIRVAVAADGRVILPSLAGKWISPMHPEIVRDGPGTCDICGMPLVRAEELGYAPKESAGALPLVIPATAPLLTGTRAIVYVALSGREGAYEGRTVTLGPKAGDYYVVRAGLEEGEQVVVNGAFKIDSALQIEGRPSMMQPEAQPAAGSAAP